MYTVMISKLSLTINSILSINCPFLVEENVKLKHSLCPGSRYKHFGSIVIVPPNLVSMFFVAILPGITPLFLQVI